MNPAYPICIISKGRADNQLTSRSLQSMGVPHSIVVEPAEVSAYEQAAVPLATIIPLDMSYKDAYDAADPAGDALGLPKGSGPARNFVWDRAAALGVDWHWIMDDNIRDFYWLNRNAKTRAGDGTLFRCMEEFCERYDNVAMAGPHYEMFVPRKAKTGPYVLNSRIYSCNLIRTGAPYRWRCRFNEDTDLSLRMLKDDWCTVLFRAFLQKKVRTLTMKGGNTDSIYTAGTLVKSKALVRLHPDVARLTWKFQRWHHEVDYGRFKQQLHAATGTLQPTEWNIGVVTV